ncbi:DUF4910 domain-containing protein [Paenibacillus agaridevorans]|uniref:DUF4910 domain-containing protein n=1 Tax=Paenibacillus agaridevorans TaxID=171404 RepID=UPI001BE49D0A|nr:DUF4910 domain-containing protein [Paenibacillus agaridevorans]
MTVGTSVDTNVELQEMEDLFDLLFPICRSITGPGVRESIQLLQKHIDLELLRVPTGTKVFDWTIPQEWHIREAWIKDSAGNKIIDFAKYNLHVVNYSAPLDQRMPLSELKQYINSMPTLPDAIPYVTSYYKRRSGFCMAHRQLESLPEGEYHAYIDSEFVNGELNLAHCVLPGSSDREILLSTYICHPSMANNELSGPLVATFLYKRLKKWTNRRFTYRFVFLPETIGSISYLHLFGQELKKQLYAGLVFTCLGGKDSSGAMPSLSYKTSRQETSHLDDFIQHIFQSGVVTGNIRPFTPIGGSDERQYCSPGFNLPVGQMARSVYGQYEAYHNSMDDKEFMTLQALMNSVDEIEQLLKAFEEDGYYVSQSPYGEVKLDQHDLYPDLNSPLNRSFSTNEQIDGRTHLNRVLTLLNYADGQHRLSEIAEKCETNIFEMLPIVQLLLQKNLLKGPYLEKRSWFD